MFSHTQHWHHTVLNTVIVGVADCTGGPMTTPPSPAEERVVVTDDVEVCVDPSTISTPVNVP